MLNAIPPRHARGRCESRRRAVLSDVSAIKAATSLIVHSYLALLCYHFTPFQLQLGYIKVKKNLEFIVPVDDADALARTSCLV
jgi:hypothetical protein